MGAKSRFAAKAIASAVLLFSAPQPTSAQTLSDRQALMEQARTATAAKNWLEAAGALKKLVALDPQWRNFQQLGNAELNGGGYEDALAAYEQGIELARVSHSQDPDTRIAIGAMLTNKGNALLKLKRNKDAIAAYTEAADLDPHSVTAYFNLCATQYNAGNFDGALAACDKAIAADPSKADAYFLKGSLLIGQSTVGKNGKVSAPPGAAAALRKYLELSPTGGHAEDVRQMLVYVGPSN